MKKLIVTLFVCLLALAAFELRAQTQRIPKLTSAQYASMKKDDIYIIMFTTKFCGYCGQAKQSLMPALMRKYEAEPNVHVYLFPEDKDQAAPDGMRLTDRLHVSEFPTFVVLYNDDKIYSHMGFSSGDQAKLENDIADKVSHYK